MKKSVLLLTILTFTLLSLNKNNDEEPSYFVQFKVFTISNQADAQLIDNKMRQKSGIKMSRTDYYTSTYYAVLNPGVVYSEDQFTNWFGKLGYEIGCFKSGIHGSDPITSPHILKTCTNEK